MLSVLREVRHFTTCKTYMHLRRISSGIKGDLKDTKDVERACPKKVMLLLLKVNSYYTYVCFAFFFHFCHHPILGKIKC